MHASLVKAMDKLLTRFIKRFPVYRSQLYGWETSVMQQISEKLGAVQIGTSIGHESSPLYRRKERQAMQEILETYMCTPVDKSSNNMSLMCKHFAVKLELDDLARNGADGSMTYDRVPDSQVSIIGGAQDFLAGLQIKSGEAVLPGYMGMPKLHKDVFSLRFIATSSRSFLRPLALKVTYLLRALETDLDWLWRGLHFPAAAEMGRAKHWILRNSAQLLPMIQAFNMQHTLQQLHAMPAWLLSWDFELLFTELNQSDLKAKLCWLLEQLFALRTQNLVRVAKGCPAKWSTGDMPANRSERENGASFQYSDLQSAKDAICYLVDHAYFQVGGAVFHQVKGIPMGINPAVYFAKLLSLCVRVFIST